MKPLPGAGRGAARTGCRGDAARTRCDGTCRAGESLPPLRHLGFPFDLTVELAREQGWTVDQAGFEQAMATQRATSRGGGGVQGRGARPRRALRRSRAGERPSSSATTTTEADATILALLGPDGPVEEAEAGDAVEIILDRTPFYGESGGQIGDTGTIRTETGVIDIDDTFKPTPDVFVHRGTVAEGFVRAGETAIAKKPHEADR